MKTNFGIESNTEKTKISSLNPKMIIILKIAISLLVAVLSFTCISKVASSPQFHKGAIELLEQKKITVMELSAGTAVVANSASLILGDRALPIATKLMDLTGYFLLLLCAIILEKYLLTIIGLASFKIILPIAALLYLINVFINNELLKKISIKLAIFSIVIFLVIPASVGISNLIEKTYNSNIQVLIDNTKQIKNDADEMENEMNNQKKQITKSNENIIADDINDDKSLLDRIKGFANGIKEGGSNVVGSVKDGVSKAVGSITEKAKQLFDKTTQVLGNTIELIAIMIVTTCIIPVLVLLFFIWLVKMFFGIDFKIDRLKIGKS